ncbi:MAG: S8 family serine peptidase, partial [Chloroflexia bacterium]
MSQFNRITLGGGGPVNLFWAEPLGGATSDYDLFILNAAGTAIVSSSTNVQNGTQDPAEQTPPALMLPTTGSWSERASGSDRFLHVNTNRSRLQFPTSGSIRGHSIAAEAYSVAATPVFPPFPNPYDSTAKVETFSSDGPRRIFFRPDGTPYAPGDFSSTGGVVRQKPDITASDGGVVSGAGGFPNPFLGTSAAAPHAAAITALVKQGKPALTSAQVRAALAASAIDIEAPGVDRDSGVGIIMADTALQSAGATPVALEVGTVTATESAGNGNGFIEPGERGSLTVQLRNNTTSTLLNVSATLSSSTPGVSIVPPGTSTYPDLAPNGGMA